MIQIYRKRSILVLETLGSLNLALSQLTTDEALQSLAKSIDYVVLSSMNTEDGDIKRVYSYVVYGRRFPLLYRSRSGFAEILQKRQKPARSFSYACYHRFIRIKNFVFELELEVKILIYLTLSLYIYVVIIST